MKGERIRPPPFIFFYATIIINAMSIFQRVLRIFQTSLLESNSHPETSFLTPFDVAVKELKARRLDRSLERKVREYLAEDVPFHFRGDPIFYLARHIATPNFETLRFLHLVDSAGMTTVIGQDVKDKFVPKNVLKKALGKLPISTGIVHKDGKYVEQFERMTIVDFNAMSGKPFSEIQTLWGESLASFHADLFSELHKGQISIVDDSEWIDRQHRGDLLAHYKKFLALFVVNGILFEDYCIEDKDEVRFKQEILKPAFRFVEKKFGYRPLITQLTPTTVESSEFWVSYPLKVRDIVRKRLAKDI